MESFISDSVSVHKYLDKVVSIEEIKLTNCSEEIIVHTFLYLCYTGTLEDICYFIDSNLVDPRMYNDLPFTKACGNDDINVPLYFINNFNVDINVNNSKPLLQTIYSSQYETAKMLINEGAIITDEIIREIIINDEYDLVQYLIYIGIDTTRISYQVLLYAFPIKGQLAQFNMLKYLSDANIDFNPIVKKIIEDQL